MKPTFEVTVQKDEFTQAAAHPRFGAYRDRSLLWKKTSKYKKLRKASEMSQTESSIKIAFDSERTCFSHEYVGKS